VLEEVPPVPGRLPWVSARCPCQAGCSMSFRECLCDARVRDELARGVVESVNVVGMDLDAYTKLLDFGKNGSAVKKNYL